MKIKHTTGHLILLSLFFILPSILLGKINTLSDFGFLIFFSLILIGFTTYKSTEENKILESIISFLQGFFLGYFELSPFNFLFIKPNITITLTIESLVAIASIVGFNIFVSMYRKRKRMEYLKQFEYNTISIQRDKKINQILGNWF